MYRASAIALNSTPMALVGRHGCAVLKACNTPEPQVQVKDTERVFDLGSAFHELFDSI
jgi:hypothetical protein